MEGLNTSYQRVAWIVDHVPAARTNYKLLMLIYWQIFDEINIPDKIMNQIIEEGTEPETISRAKRKVIENNYNIDEIEKRILEAIKNVNEGNDKGKD